MAIVFNGIDRLIEVTDPLIFSLDAERDIYSEWKRWSQLGDNSKYAPAFTLNSVFGGNPTVEGQAAPKYFFLTNFWRVLIDNGNVVSVGLNLYTENYSTPYLVANGSGISDRNSDAVSVNAEAIEYASFNGGVTIDVANISGRAQSGIGYPIGTIRAPSNNLTDLQSIATNRGIDTIYVIGNLTIPAGFNFSRYKFEGESPTKSTITIDNAANVLNCEFKQATVSGILDGNSEITHARVSNLNFVDGKVQNCDLGPDIITLGTSVNANIFSCFSTVPGSSTPVIDMNGTGILGLRDYNGGIELRNYNGAGSHSIDMSSGQIKLDPNTITSGKFVCRGVGKLIDAVTGQPIKTGPWNGGVEIVNELINLTTIGEAGDYGKGIYIDAINGRAGTTDPIGLQRDPVNNLADAITLAGIRGTSTLVFMENYTFAPTDNISNYELIGRGYQLTTLTFTSGGLFVLCDIHDCKVTGLASGITAFINCFLSDFGSVGVIPSAQPVILNRCKIGGAITLPSNYSGALSVVNCYAEVALPSYPILNMGGSTGNLLVNHWSGEILVTNLTGGNNLDIRFGQGEMQLDTATVTNANIHAIGGGYLRDENGVDIATGVWNGGVNVINDTITQNVAGGATVWTELEKQESLAYGKKASDNAEQANLKL